MLFALTQNPRVCNHLRAVSVEIAFFPSFPLGPPRFSIDSSSAYVTLTCVLNISTVMGGCLSLLLFPAHGFLERYSSNQSISAVEITLLVSKEPNGADCFLNPPTAIYRRRHFFNRKARDAVALLSSFSRSRRAARGDVGAYEAVGPDCMAAYTHSWYCCAKRALTVASAELMV